MRLKHGKLNLPMLLARYPGLSTFLRSFLDLKLEKWNLKKPFQWSSCALAIVTWALHSPVLECFVSNTERSQLIEPI